MSIPLLSGVKRANDKYRATLRATWIASPPATTLQVTAIPQNVPTFVTVGWKTDYETLFAVTGTSGSSPTTYALTGVTRIKGANQNLPEGATVHCLNHEEFFNQYETKINDVITEINTALQTVDDLDNIVTGDFITVSDGPTMNFDLNNGANRKFRTSITADRTFTLQNASSASGTPFIVRITQPSTARTVTWFTGFTITWQGATGQTQNEIPANKTGTYGFIMTGATTMDGFFLGASA